jgi:hypothetical protein
MEHWSLFSACLRDRHGQNQASYGREEATLANSLFPENIACVQVKSAHIHCICLLLSLKDCARQAFIPLDSEVRFLAVCLRSPFQTSYEAITQLLHGVTAESI